MQDNPDKALVLVAHPDMRVSRVNRAWAAELSRHSDQITVHDLYAAYPRGDIDVEVEQSLLKAHHRIVFQFPMHWFSAPSLLKQWIDTVLALGFAWGLGANALEGKEFLVATCTGSRSDFYLAGGRNQYTPSEFLRPFQGIANYVGGKYLPPHILHGTFYDLTDQELDEDCKAYAFRALAPAYRSTREVVI